MSRTVIIRGNLNPDGSLDLEQKPDLNPGPVQVTLQSVSVGCPAERNLADVLKEIHSSQRASGFKGRSREAIDAEIAQMRSEWDDPSTAIEPSRD